MHIYSGSVLQFPYESTMATLPVPPLPQYRITLFYGPEPVAHSPSCLHCVFNVKKRSWKSGIQVSVEIEDGQIARARQLSGFDGWLAEQLAHLPDDERRDQDGRARELFVQELCALKLDAAIEGGLRQENCRIESGAFRDELDRAVSAKTERLRQRIVAELDLANR